MITWKELKNGVLFYCFWYPLGVSLYFLVEIRVLSDGKGYGRKVTLESLIRKWFKGE